MGTDEMQAAFRHAVAQFNRMNESASGRRYELQAFVDIIGTADTVKLSRLSKQLINVCHFALVICNEQVHTTTS